ncbi:sensor histidine kinase [Massilia endophytica]|uniref:sensor histidine kinase n=1 Tax=Massilia endophytica TaxID=2899220 RepID=UPI001E55DBAE|nr:HAMP domain-containing sensor histidine kinase [Massilia endophytica]UGQ45256.1 HAMP domain-containing histidine kinase [Massilia endophytica]
MPTAPDQPWNFRTRRRFGPLLRYRRDDSKGALRVTLLAWLGVAGFPAYYWVCTVLFPQPYESVTARLIGMAIALAGLAAARFSYPYREIYVAVALTYFLPFFCSYMFLMNEGGRLWGQVLMVALVALFHFEMRLAVPAYLAGTLLAVACVAIQGRTSLLLLPSVLEQLPVHAFAISALSAVRIGRAALEQQKLSGLKEGLGTVAHEMRTPLASVDANVRGLTRLLQCGDGDEERQQEVRQAMTRIQYEVRHMNHLIDMFLVSASATRRRMDPFETVSMEETVQAAMRRYPFTGPAQSDMVSVEVRSNFRFPGQQELAVVVLLNLLRNAMKAIHRAGKGRVRIVVDGARATPRLLFIDTACGISARRVPLIFQRFYAYPSHNGTGIGLALCRQIMKAWNANIRCISRESAYAIFILEFPRSGAL